MSRQLSEIKGFTIFFKPFSRSQITILKRLGKLSVAILFSLSLKAQEVKLIYNIIKSGDIIGRATVTKIINGSTVIYKMSSDTETRFIVSIAASTREESVFNNGSLVKSSFCQKVNGKEKVNRNVRWNGSAYDLINKGVFQASSFQKIVLNMMMLYFSMPTFSSTVFSDHYHEFVSINKISAEEFKIVLPDGTENHYYYKNGVCKQLDITSTFYKVKMILIV